MAPAPRDRGGARGTVFWAFALVSLLIEQLESPIRTVPSLRVRYPPHLAHGPWTPVSAVQINAETGTCAQSQAVKEPWAIKQTPIVVGGGVVCI
ncbi:hypothetical protein S40285_10534 [Stachybotrys chlorohalonatus IBT 40285]|uniref:Secreted protein n=1 Tax=Stachybotrys chlorohalonatus (strain IBT 40285) TaxID=1283841 RepID=A0A084QE50_STAC4|nr:hypothetical protein S40285_10534 [Stachybotrys chlorohalonata IBT 40285]